MPTFKLSLPTSHLSCLRTFASQTRNVPLGDTEYQIKFIIFSF